VWVRGAKLVFASGDMTTGPHDVLHDVRGALTTEVDDFDVEHSHGMEVFRFISARLDLTGQVPSLEAANFWAAPSNSFRLSGGMGDADIHAAIDHGVFIPDSRLAFRTRHVGVAIDNYEFHLDGDVSIAATAPPGEGGLVTARVAGQVQLEGNGHLPPQVRGIEASYATTSVDVTRRWDFAGARLDADEVTLADLRWLNDARLPRPKSLQLNGGQARAQGKFSFTPDHEVEGSVAARIEGASGTAGNARIAASSLWGHVRVLPEGARGDIEARDVTVGASGACLSAQFGSVSLQAQLQTPAGGTAVANLEGALTEAWFRWGEFTAHLGRAKVAGRWTQGQTEASLDASGVHLKNATGPPRSWQADAGSLSLKATLAMNDQSVLLPLRVDVQRVSGQVGKTRVEGDVAAHLDISSADSSRRTADLSGVIQTKHVKVSSGSRQVNGWWADFQLDRMRLDSRQDFDLFGPVHARFRDGLPALYVLASEKEIPKWVPSLLPLHDLTLDLEVERFCRWTDVQILHASGGPLRAEGRLQVEPGETRGAVLFRLAPVGAVSVGLNFVEDHSDTSFLAGSDWLQQRLTLLRDAATAKHDAPCARGPSTCE
jgi:hypothetical protein